MKFDEYMWHLSGSRNEFRTIHRRQVQSNILNKMVFEKIAVINTYVKQTSANVMTDFCTMGLIKFRKINFIFKVIFPSRHNKSAKLLVDKTVK